MTFYNNIKSLVINISDYNQRIMNIAQLRGQKAPWKQDVFSFFLFLSFRSDSSGRAENSSAASSRCSARPDAEQTEQSQRESD